MGQRLQAYIYCQNPINGLMDQYKSLKKYGGNKEELDQLKSNLSKFEKAFGTKPHAVIVFHHQWLYGRSSLLAAANLIDFNLNCDKEANPFKANNNITGEEYLSLLTNLLGLFKSKIAKIIGRFGYEHFRLLNFFEPQMRTDCRLGDNNDGIFVIDCLNDSYCFANIGNGDSTIMQLPIMEPCTAHDYVKLYYPEKVGDSQTANVPAPIEERDTYFRNNVRLNKLFCKTFEQYRLMSHAELNKLFPDSYRLDTNSEIGTN